MPTHELSAAALLELWQAADARPPVERALALAAAADADGASEAELARLPLGRRDERLVALHSALGGRAFEATATCPACGEEAEFAVEAEALVARAAEAVPPAPLEVDGAVVAWRPPDSTDLAAAAATGDAGAAERVLLRRCVEAGAEMNPDARAEVERAMAAADPLAEVLVDVSCPACGGAFAADLDLANFVWAALRARALRLLREVDVLARAYGWTETEVLALGERRRAAYLELALGGAA
jgi:hypothetical protein